MGMFSNIVDRIFHHDKADAPNYQVPTVPSPLASNIPSAQASGGAQATVDASQVLSQLASKSSEKLNYKESIVDLLKLLDLDSSLSARKELATELHYTGDTSDTAKMNVWLSKQVMTKLAENGGKIPPELRA